IIRSFANNESARAFASSSLPSLRLGWNLFGRNVSSRSQLICARTKLVIYENVHRFCKLLSPLHVRLSGAYRLFRGEQRHVGIDGSDAYVQTSQRTLSNHTALHRARRIHFGPAIPEIEGLP